MGGIKEFIKNKKMHNPRYKAKTAKIFDVLAKDGYHVEDVEFLSGYFIFDFDKDSVVISMSKSVRAGNLRFGGKFLMKKTIRLGLTSLPNTREILINSSQQRLPMWKEMFGMTSASRAALVGLN